MSVTPPSFGNSSKTAKLILSVDLSCVHIRIERAVTVLERMPTSDMTV